MTKPISSYPEDQRRRVIERRLKTKSSGSGYWAAVQAAEKLGIPVPKSGASKPRRRESDEDRQRREKKHLRRRPVHTNGIKMKDLARTR